MIINRRHTTLVSLLTCLILASCSCNKDSSGPSDNPSDSTEVFQRYLESVEFQSSILQRTVRYSVYLPEGYDTSKVSYPVTYMLHGYGDNEKAWYLYGDLRRHANMRTPSGKTIPMIYIMPNGNNNYYVNRWNGQYNYMNMFVHELVPRIDSIYKTKKDAAYRAVMGYSMGGYGAYILPSMHPEVFSISVSLSMSWRTDSQYMAEPASGWDSQFGRIFGGEGKTGEERLTPYFKAHSPFHFLKTNDASQYSSVRYFMYCGTDEEKLFDTAEALHQLMNEKGITHFYSTGKGGHSWYYWYGATSDALLRIDSLMNK